MVVTRKRAVLFSFVAGIVVPYSIEFGGRYLDSVGVHRSLWWSTLFIYIWPTGLWLIGTSGDLRGYLAFTISVIANSLLYALIALVVGYFIKLLRKPHEEDWWPGAPGSRR
jgi:hypothetical protein